MRSLILPTLREPHLTGRALVDARLPADPTELGHARRRVANAAEAFGLSSKAAYEFVFAVNEAVTNAIKHGHPDARGTIGLRVDCEGDSLVCWVTDAGPFIPRSPGPPSAEAESGRGFAFMSALTDELDLTVEPDQTTVRLCKQRAATNGHG